MTKVIAFDVGLHSLGVAICDETKIPVTLPAVHTKDPYRAITRLIKENEPEQIVLGVPNHGPIRTLVESIYNDLQSTYHDRVFMQDEDFSSKLASDYLIQAGVPQGRRKEKNHSAAAAQILTDFLEFVRIDT